MLVFLILLAGIAPLVIVTPLQDQWALPKLATTAALTGAALVWGAVLLARDRWPAGRWPVSLWAPALVFVLVNVLALIFALDWRWSLMGERLRYQGLATTLLYVLVFFVAAVSVRTTRDLRSLLLALFLGALGASVYGLMQKAGLAWWPDPIPERPGSTLGQANTFGAFLVAAAGASVFLLLTARARWQRVALGAGLLVILCALGFTVSRSAYIAAGAVVFLWGIAAGHRLLQATRSRWRLALDGGVVVLCLTPLILVTLAVFFLGLPQGRIAVIGDANSQAVQGRLSLWRLGLEMARDRPLLGYGQDAFGLLFARYRDRPDLAGIGTANLAPESAHNFFVDLLSGTGALGTAAFLALVGALFWHVARRAAPADAELRLALLALGISAIGYLVALFFGFSESMTTWVLWLLLGATAGLLARVAPASRSDALEAESGTLASGLAAVGLALVGALALGWAATTTAADLAAGQAARASQRGDHVAAARLFGRAVTLNPIEKTYLGARAEAYELASAGPSDKIQNLERAVDQYETLLDRYEPGGFDVWRLAQAKLKLARLRARPIDDIIEDFERAVALDPFNEELRRAVISVYEGEALDERAKGHHLAIWCWSQCD